MKRKFKIPLISMTQYSLDLPNNTEKIIESIKTCKNKGLLYRPSNELELSGNNCNDHFLELDFIKLCYKFLLKIILDENLDNIVYEIGICFLIDWDLYNCIITVFNKKILNIRPKIFLANSSNYRETRYFKSWDEKEIKIPLPKIISEAINQKEVLVSNKILNINGFCIGKMICEEMWDEEFYLFKKLIKNDIDAVIISNASEFTIDKENLRINQIKNMNDLNKNISIIYNNLNGYDGDRMIFDGNSFIFNNSKLVKKWDQLGLYDFALDYYEVEYEEKINEESINIIINQKNEICKSTYIGYNQVEKIDDCSKNYEMLKLSYSITSYLYFYLKYSNAKFFVLALSGGSDSSTVAASIYFLAKRLFNLYKNDFLNDNQIYFFKNNCKNILNNLIENPKNIKDIVNEILITIYLETEFSSKNTLNLSLQLSKELNSFHYSLNITELYKNFHAFIKKNLLYDLKFLSEGGSYNDDITLQNLQARIRLIVTYLISQTICSINKKGKFGLVLSTGNLDEIAIGYFTKYDNSSGDLGIIGSLNKSDIYNLLIFYSEDLDIKILSEIEKQIPSAELRPILKNYKQEDKDDIGWMYKKVEFFTDLFINKKKGLFKLFKNEKNKDEIIRYMNLYIRNRHKITVLPPCIHLKNNNLDDNRFNFRPVIYPNMNYIKEME